MQNGLDICPAVYILPGTMSMSKQDQPPTADPDKARYQLLKAELLGTGYIRRGSVVRRFMPCGKRGCHCHGSPPSQQLHGTYYQWTRKVQWKTVTVRLTEEEAGLLAGWIANARRMELIVARMEALSLRATTRMLKSLRRK